MNKPTIVCENLKPKMFLRKTRRGAYWEIRNVYWTARGMRICRSELFEGIEFASDDAHKMRRVMELLDMSDCPVYP